MKKVTITSDTPKNPLEQMGFYAGTCWGADTSDKEKNIRRATKEKRRSNKETE